MSILRMTRAQFSFENHEFSYRLPFIHTGQENEELVEKWMELAKRHVLGGAECTNILRDDTGYVRLSFLYEGWGEYHPFVLMTQLVYLTDLDVLVVQGWIKQDVHDLMEIILRNHFLPYWAHMLGLESM